MITLFDQGYAVDAYARELAKKAKEEGIERGIEQGIEQGREDGIRAAVEMGQEYGAGFEETVVKIMEKFDITEKEAFDFTERYWKKAD